MFLSKVAEAQLKHIYYGLGPKDVFDSSFFDILINCVLFMKIVKRFSRAKTWPFRLRFFQYKNKISAFCTESKDEKSWSEACTTQQLERHVNSLE